ncbi:MAG: UDP-3-O-(3-hydroxymyristoyl)glucosamine N-acyltransferase [Mariprofundus sp.]|nr:UDP-3-O-(3-hydroxymyristoyl)glucosamine N-acyltransferase [Mariprofundus sp.]
MKVVSLLDIAGIVNGTVEGIAEEDLPNIRISGVNTLSEAGDTEISFLANPCYKHALSNTAAAAVLLAANAAAPDHCGVIRVADPYLAFALLQRFFHPQPIASGQRHCSAVIDPSALLADDVELGAHAVIGAHVHIGVGSMIGAGCVIGENVRIGERCLLHANVVVREDCVIGNDVILQPGAVIGSDGFGYAWSGSQHLKIPQAGRVVLEDDVEIGANTCIDRGAIDDTVIERGVKLDNQIQVAHNVRIGAYSIMASQVGISGSTVIGKGCQFGGQAGLAGHIKVGDGVKLAAKSGVMSDLVAGGTYAGAPAMPQRLWLKVSALTLKLPELWKTRNKI